MAQPIPAIDAQRQQWYVSGVSVYPNSCPVSMKTAFFRSHPSMVWHISFPYKPTILICAILPFLAVLYPFPVAGKAITLSRIDELDRRLQDFSVAFYETLAAQKKAVKTPKFDQLSKLDHRIRTLHTEQRPVEAVALIRYNLTLIKENIDTPYTFYFIKFLLENNAQKTAMDLYDHALRDGNKIIISNIKYAFAKYYLKRKKWEITLKYLDGIVADLVTNDAHYALLIKGVSLQNLKKHRQAIKVYQNIPNTSKYHAHAILNSAVAYIRQDWWTDAHTVINELLQKNRNTVSDEMANRLFVILGYSLMRKEFYRNARDAFRSVNLHSRYANQALLGLALTAASQNDYIGALNAASILKKKTDDDLPVEESYLLLPYIYSRLNQHLTASAGFEEAIQRYTQRIQALESLLTSNNNLGKEISIIANNNMLRIDGHVLNFTRRYPKSFLDNYKILSNIEKHINSEENRRQFARIHSDYQATLDEIIRELLNQRVSHLSSYADQSRYGLARVYDNSLAE